MIGIICIGDISFTPFLNNYINILEKKNIEYEVLFWNRELLRRNLPENYISFNYESDYNKQPYKKINDFIHFSKWCREQITKRKYEKLIVLLTLTGFFIADLLINEYKNKYIFDIRDYSYEHFKLFYYIEKKIINNSFFTCISSEAFKEFLPNYNYMICHNFRSEDLKNRKLFKKKGYGCTLNIVFVGCLRYFNHQINIIDKLKNDTRFNVFYHGSGPEYEKYIQYCNKNNVNNVFFTGRYNDSEKFILLKDADILNNSYMSPKYMEVKYAISNKYYDGLIYGIPQLVEKDTYKHKLVEKNGLGIGLDVEDNDFADKLYEFYFSLQTDKFNANCECELRRVISENKIYEHKIEEFLDA